MGAMIDLFGVGRDPQEQIESAPPPSDAAPGSHRLWAALLVLDAAFIIVFGGAVAAIAYKHWQAPAPAAARRRPAPPAAEAAKPVETAAAKPEPEAPAPEAEKPAPKAARREESSRPARPSLSAGAMKPHETPAPAPAAPAFAAAAPAAPAAGGKTKAQAVVFKLDKPRANSVSLVGAFIVHGGRKEMTKGKDGVWTVKLYLNRGQYRYFFAVDKKKTLDPENPDSDRGASLLTVP